MHFFLGALRVKLSPSLVNLHAAFMWAALKIEQFQKIYFRNTVRVQTVLIHFVGPDLDSKCLQLS